MRLSRALGSALATLLAASVAPPALALVGGSPAPHDSWSFVVWLDNGCTGTVVDPNTILFAAHCGLEPSMARVGAVLSVGTSTDGGEALRVTGGEPFSLYGCVAHPDARFEIGADVGLCRARGQLPTGSFQLQGQGEDVTKGEQLLLVGYGATTADVDDGGERRVAWATVQSADPELIIGDETRGSCRGDSGGPAFREEPDGTLTLVAVLSAGEVGRCGRGWYTEVRDVRDWLEENLEASHQPPPSCAHGKKPAGSHRAGGFLWFAVTLVSRRASVARRSPRKQTPRNGKCPRCPNKGTGGI